MEQINYMKRAALGKKKQPVSYNFISRWRNQRLRHIFYGNCLRKIDICGPLQIRLVNLDRDSFVIANSFNDVYDISWITSADIFPGEMDA